MTLSTQFMTMLAMIGMGIFFGAALDTYNRFLKRSKRKSWLVFINDLLFWILQGLFIFFVLFRVNQGELRFYIFIALLCGFAAYQGLLKATYLRWLERLISFVIAIFRFFVKLIHLLIYKPIHVLITTLFEIVLMIGKGLFVVFIGLVKSVWFVIKVLFMPISWILLLIWKLCPKTIKKSVEKIYNKLAGKCKIIKNIIIKWVSHWKKDKE
jgi:spore cortex biosynthesis protein YabQ